MKKNKVSIVEVGLRDGLQNEKVFLKTSDKVAVAKLLLQSGVKRVELGSFVREDWVPQMADTKKVVNQIFNLSNKSKYQKNQMSVLVPNLQGLEQAIKNRVSEIALFASCTEGFSKANLNASKSESAKRFKLVAQKAKENNIKVRGYLSVCFGCPFDGPVLPKVVVKEAEKLFEMGCFEVSIGDTIGVAGPKDIEKVFTLLSKTIPIERLAGHFHDTRGQAVANALKAYELGVRVFDSSVGGIGGCPYAPYSTGNVATEELVYMFNSMGISTGIDLPLFLKAADKMSKLLLRPLPSRLARAGLVKVPASQR